MWASTEQHEPTHRGVRAVVHAPGPQQPHQILIKIHLVGVIEVPGDRIEVQVGQVESREWLLVVEQRMRRLEEPEQLLPACPATPCAGSDVVAALASGIGPLVTLGDVEYDDVPAVAVGEAHEILGELAVAVDDFLEVGMGIFPAKNTIAQLVRRHGVHPP